MKDSEFAGKRLVAQAGLAIVLTLSALGRLVGVGYRPVFADANPGGAVSTQIGGTVFQDFNNNGVMNTSGDAANPAIDKGVAGINVSAYISGSLTTVATTTSGANGIYTLLGLTAGTQYCIEFTNLPAEFEPSFHGSSGSTTVPSSGTNVQFAAAGTSNVSYDRRSSWTGQRAPMAQSRLWLRLRWQMRSLAYPLKHTCGNQL